MDDCDEFMHGWLNIEKGVVDSKDSPLNISYEALQQNQILRAIKKNMVKNCLEMFAAIAENRDGYKKFHEQFGKRLELDVRYEDSTNHTKVVEWRNINTFKSRDEQINLKEYVDRIKQGQNEIYYNTGESIEARTMAAKEPCTLADVQLQVTRLAMTPCTEVHGPCMMAWAADRACGSPTEMRWIFMDYNY